ncbi:L,D-transpeptidase [Roseovarius sp. SCSIO 43702]|uniref:L,D-transpeptidase n=1 Tax=Roseovarius sp. SCSIO 43702 TaxID=2823043 RepID=UPI001C735437|nr:L,D-transpeptidase [Roseovarius sp. SCSIO 43702]QYX57881.1 L,D-transpeptidase [Roseovarius sp. SCSIO 43702]
MLTRRRFVALGAAAGLGACTRPSVATEPRQILTTPRYPPSPHFYGAITDEPYPVPAVPDGTLAPEHWRREVANPWPDRAPGTIIVDPSSGELHFLDDAETATRYAVSVGAAGRDWEGTARLQFCRRWPRWKVPEQMIARQPELAPYSVANGGMDPGPGNPMGARALYLFENGVDTLYRIHGSASPRELGRAVSSGCIRMLDQDVIHLHAKAVHGADVTVLPSMRPERFETIY